MKCVVVGDGGIGKTCLLERFKSNNLPDEFWPHVLDAFHVNSSIDTESITLSIFDTPGQEEFIQLRTEQYLHTDIFVICFSLVDPGTFDNVATKWVPELRRCAPPTPFILVGTKLDLREDRTVVEELAKHGVAPVTREQGKKRARQIKAAKYFECSALREIGIQEIFSRATYVGARPSQSSKFKLDSCSIS